MQEKDVKNGREIMQLVCALSPEELIALAQMLGVKVLTDKLDKQSHTAVPREGEDVIWDCVEAIYALPRKDRRIVVKALRPKGARLWD